MSAARARLSFANVVSIMALFVALGGTAWAISANTVGSKQLKPNAVRNSDIAANAVTSPKVADGSLQSTDFAAGQLPAGAQGPAGDRGATGPAGVNGVNGADGTDGTDGTDGDPGSPAASMLTARVSLPTAPGGIGFDTREAPIVGVTTATAGIDPTLVEMISPPVPTVARDLTVRLENAPGGAAGGRLVLVGVGGTSALQCQVAPTETKCTDTTHVVNVPPSTSLSLGFLSNDAVATDALVTWRSTAP
jgi:hypothetical protein